MPITPISIWYPSETTVQDSWANSSLLDSAVAKGYITAEDAADRNIAHTLRERLHRETSQHRLNIAAEKLGALPTKSNNWGLSKREFTRRVFDVNHECMLMKENHESYYKYVRAIKLELETYEISLVCLQLERHSAYHDYYKQREWQKKYGPISQNDILSIAFPAGAYKSSARPDVLLPLTKKQLRKQLGAKADLATISAAASRPDVLLPLTAKQMRKQCRAQLHTHQSDAYISSPQAEIESLAQADSIFIPAAHSLSHSQLPIARTLDAARRTAYCGAQNFCSEAVVQNTLSHIGDHTLLSSAIGLKPHPSNDIEQHLENLQYLCLVAEAYLQTWKEAQGGPIPIELAEQHVLQPIALDESTSLMSETAWKKKWAKCHDIYDIKYNINSKLVYHNESQPYQAL